MTYFIEYRENFNENSRSKKDKYIGSLFRTREKEGKTARNI